MEGGGRMRVYISGKITGNSNYMEEFSRAQTYLEEKGYAVCNPAATCATLPLETKYEEYMKIALTMLNMCDAIYMLLSWKDSNGAKIEHEKAMEKGMILLYE